MADRAVWQRTIVDERGNIIPGAEVTVRSYPGGSLITLYEGPDGTQVKNNPFVTGHDGFARFWAESQRAEIIAIGAGSSIRWIVDLLNADEVIGDAVSEATAAAAVAVGEAEAAADRAEAARDAAQLSAGVYEDTATGLAATSDGDYFSVPSPSSDEYLILYRNDSGSATEISRYPSADVVQSLIYGEPLQSIRADVDSVDFALAFVDAAGRAAGGFDEEGRFVARIGQDVERFETYHPDVVWGISDPRGQLALAVDQQGRTSTLGLQMDTGDIVTAQADGVAFAIVDESGRAAFIVYTDGTTSAGGPPDPEPDPDPTHDPDRPDPEPGPYSHEVFWAFAEPIDDPSEELFITWLSDDNTFDDLEYRERGGSTWTPATSFRTRAFPNLSGRYLHTVALEGLSPDTLYDFRVPGSPYVNTVKTCPVSGSIKMTLASDWQRQAPGDYDADSPFRILGNISSSKSPDLLLFNGDVNNSNGQYTTFWAEDYNKIFGVLHDHWRGGNGALIPMVVTLGNHEGSGADGTGHASQGGDGIPGMIVDICSWSYSAYHTSAFARSVATVRIGNLAAVVALETDHTVPIMDQLNWYKNQLTGPVSEVAHSFTVGHVPPFYCHGKGWERRGANLRNFFWTEAQDHSGSNGSMRAWLSAHTHQAILSRKLKMAYDPLESDEVNDNNFYRDSDGIVMLGCGSVGATPFALTGDVSRLSNIDGLPWWRSIIARHPSNPDAYQTFGPVTNPRSPIFNIWVIEAEQSGGWRADCLNLDGRVFFSHIE